MNTTVKNESLRSEFVGREFKESTAAKQAPNFDHLAKFYRWMEFLTFGPLLSPAEQRFLLRLSRLGARL